MTKEQKLDIWKKDADDNGFVCAKCAYSKPDILIYNCRCTLTNTHNSKNFFCGHFTLKEADGEK